VLSFVAFSTTYIQHNKLKNIEKMQGKRLTKIYERYKAKKPVQKGKVIEEKREETREETEETKKLLEKESALLDKAFKQNYISKDAYQKGKYKIENMQKKIK
ncbi:MAG: hypothetical protein Q8O03_05215, partial [Nanoarchaeota archaeon]|nr:hypothetical protein [Nanoarchaeota archaeon]